MPLVQERQKVVKVKADLIDTALELLRVKNTDLYRAAYPGYQSNFTRDSLLYGLLANDYDALLDQIDYSSEHQGKVANSDTGEEPGKIHHEFPSGQWRGRPTEYNACDTTAMYLIAIATLANKMPDVLKTYEKSITSAIKYIQRHLKNDLFFESPALCGATSFAVRVTYWKDSVLNGPYEEPNYPITYSLVHFQNAYALKLIGQALKRRDLLELASRMTKVGIAKLWAKDHFIVARDGDGTVIDAPSSDSLHALLYIEPYDIPSGYASSIEVYMRRLETKAGYRTGLPVGKSDDDYHTRYVWVHEQALLHSAASKHGLEESATITARVVDYLATLPELIDPTKNFAPAGNAPQLWVVGASKYFSDKFISVCSDHARTNMLICK